MAKRECPSLQKSLDWCEGTPQYPGIRRRVYYCNKNLITGWPTLQRDDFGRVTDATYQGEFTLAADATWQHIDINIKIRKFSHKFPFFRKWANLLQYILCNTILI